MKKSFKFYAICWVILFAVFNAVCFITPNEVAGMTKFGGAFWAGYIFVTLAFFGQLACAYVAFKAENNQKLFYNLPLITVSYTGLIVTLVVGALCMALPNLPNWVGILVCLLILAFTAIAIVKASAAANAVSDIDQRVATKTAFIRSLTVDAEHLMNTAKTAELKDLAKKVYEAVRYSDPMSDAALVEIEEKMKNGFADLENAVEAGDAELAASVAGELLSLVDLRNKKCKLLK
mgnify:FL=1